MVQKKGKQVSKTTSPTKEFAAFVVKVSIALSRGIMRDSDSAGVAYAPADKSVNQAMAVKHVLTHLRHQVLIHPAHQALTRASQYHQPLWFGVATRTAAAPSLWRLMWQILRL